MEHVSQFHGASGALIVSMIAFTIVFLVLIGLTLVIYAIKFFSGSGEKKDSGTPSTPVTPAAVASVAAPQPPAGKSQITAAITAAILAATQGRGRILSVSPALQDGIAPLSRTTWKTTGIVERISGRLVRPWKH